MPLGQTHPPPPAGPQTLVSPDTTVASEDSKLGIPAIDDNEAPHNAATAERREPAGPSHGVASAVLETHRLSQCFEIGLASEGVAPSL